MAALPRGPRSRGPRAAHPALLAAGQVRRRPRRRRHAVERRPRRPRLVRDLRPARRHREVRRRPRASSSRRTRSPGSAAPSSTSCARSTGCRGRCGRRRAASSRRCRPSRHGCTAAPPRRNSPPNSTSTVEELQDTLLKISMTSVAALDEALDVGEGDRLRSSTPCRTCRGPARGLVRGRRDQGTAAPGHHPPDRTRADRSRPVLLRGHDARAGRRRARGDRVADLPDPHQGGDVAAHQAARPQPRLRVLHRRAVRAGRRRPRGVLRSRRSLVIGGGEAAAVPALVRRTPSASCPPRALARPPSAGRSWSSRPAARADRRSCLPAARRRAGWCAGVRRARAPRRPATAGSTSTPGPGPRSRAAAAGEVTPRRRGRPAPTWVSVATPTAS